MKYYKLKKALPTFEQGELFCLVGPGSLVRVKDNLMAYSHTTLAKFPNILKDWFIEVPAPERDSKTKHAFMEYIDEHREERFFQAVRNFAREYLGEDFSFIYASKREQEYYKQHFDKFKDTFYMECDAIHKLKKKEDDEEQRANEY